LSASTENTSANFNGQKGGLQHYKDMEVAKVLTKGGGRQKERSVFSAPKLSP